VSELTGHPAIKPPAPQSVPVFQVVVTDKKRRSKYVGVGNGVLLDHDTQGGIIVTNAHLINFEGGYRSNECFVYLPHAQRYHRAESNKGWINWNADLAYVRLAGVDLSSYPQVSLKTSGFNKYEKIWLMGNVSKGLENRRFVTIPGRVTRWKSNFGVTLPDVQDMWDMEKKLIVAHDRKRVLYKNYIKFRLFGGNEKIVPKMSGSALVDQDGKLVGILSKGDGDDGLGIPSAEFKTDNRRPPIHPAVPQEQPSFRQRLYSRLAMVAA